MVFVIVEDLFPVREPGFWNDSELRHIHMSERGEIVRAKAPGQQAEEPSKELR